MCELLVPILLLVRNWCQFFSCMRYWYQFFTCKSNKYQFYTSKMNWYQFFTHERGISTNYSHKNSEIWICCLAKQKSNKANMSNLYPGQRVILENLKITKHKSHFSSPLSSPWVGACLRAKYLFPCCCIHDSL